MPTTRSRVLQLTGAQTRLAAALRAGRPRDADTLHAWLGETLQLTIPRVPLVPGSDAPFDYLVHTFFDGGDAQRRDAVVWANRGGGKTFLGAVATLLDLVFKPGIRVCLLGGSLEQSGRMYSHLRRLLDRPAVRPMVARPPTQRRVVLINGSRARVLCQSQRSVRGIRVQRLRCDEVELFDPEVWDAAKFVTRSARCGGVEVRGSVEALSTMHEPHGLMAKLVEQPGLRVLRWTAMDVASRCEPWRECDGCVLWRDCEGRAKEATGFVPIADLLDQRTRSGDAQWDAEMMCRRPSTRSVVFGEFGEQHVVEGVRDGGFGVGGRRLPNARPLTPTSSPPLLVAGLDFGLRNPLAIVWAEVHCNSHDPRDWPVTVIDNYCEAGRVLDSHLDAIADRGHGTPAWIGVDPAGHAASSQTGCSDIAVVRRRGYAVRSRASRIEEGLAIIRRRLDRGTLRVHARCAKLIDAMRTYHYPAKAGESEQPVKDGPDHLCDALRYLLVNLERGGGAVTTRGY